jgi:fructosamine-3-kinase
MNREFLKSVAEQLNAHFNKTLIIESCKQVYGGDINQSFIIQTSEEKYFLKINGHAADDMFEKEFNGLNLLRKPACIDVPKPILYGGNFIIMECITKENPCNDFWLKFAESLAALHKQTNLHFGLYENNYIGSLSQVNNYCKDWAPFYSTYRIMPLVKKAYDQNKFDKQDISLAEKLCSKFDELFPAEHPSLLYGDLWSGNFMVTENGLAIIYDPAVYYGHREMDIGMTLLFGGFDKKFYEYYNEIFPLGQGWQQRIDLCQLYPLLVHLVLFGGHYYYNAMDILKKYG